MVPSCRRRLPGNLHTGAFGALLRVLVARTWQRLQFGARAEGLRSFSEPWPATRSSVWLSRSASRGHQGRGAATGAPSNHVAVAAAAVAVATVAVAVAVVVVSRRRRRSR